MRIMIVFVVLASDCSSQPRYQPTNRALFTLDTKAGLDCWAKVSSPEREKARAGTVQICGIRHYSLAVLPMFLPILVPVLIP